MYACDLLRYLFQQKSLFDVCLKSNLKTNTLGNIKKITIRPLCTARKLPTDDGFNSNILYNSNRLNNSWQKYFFPKNFRQLCLSSGTTDLEVTTSL